MAVSVNGASGVAVGDGYNTTLTASLTVAAGSQRLLVAFTNGACTGVTYGGTAMTMSDSRSGIASALDTKCWTLADPTVGTANLVATRASDNPMMLTGRCVNGYNSGAGFSFAHYTLTFRNSPQSLAASIPAGGMGLSYIVDNSQSTLGYTAGAGSTKDAEFTAAGYYAYAVESIPGAASAAEWSWASGQRDIAHHVIVISGDVVAPTITGPSGAAGAATSTKSVAEGVTAVHTFTADMAVSWSKNGGADEADFTLNASTGELAFAAAPDFEAPGDSDANNTYVVVVRATATTGGATADQTVTVTATNQSEPPLAPTIGTATAGNASASVAFTPPTNTGRPAITGYTATSSPGGITGTGATSPITVSGLTNGTAYTFTVTAANPDGTGPASAASNSVTPSAGGSSPAPHRSFPLSILNH